MEKHLGRRLEFNEVVHHIDGDIHNDVIDNLEVMSRADHARLHTKLHWQDEQYRKACSHPMSEENKRKVSLRHKGKTITDEHKKQISKTRRLNNSTRSKLHEEDIPVIRKMVKDGIDYFLIAFVYQIDKSMISMIKNRTRWAWVN